MTGRAKSDAGASLFILLGLSLDRASAQPLSDQLSEQIASAIAGGRLAAGTPMPSTRILADELDCSRNTVKAAFEKLIAEGYLVGVARMNTVVAERAPDSYFFAERPILPAEVPTPASSILSSRGVRISTHRRARCAQSARPFELGHPESEEFPFDVWVDLYRSHWSKPRRVVIDSADPRGYLPLRSAIAQYLSTMRGLTCDAEDVIVTGGGFHAMDLCMRLAMQPGDAIWIEEATAREVYAMVEANGLVPVDVPIDEQGMIVSEGIRRAPHARMAIVTPAHQHPLGMTMSLQRRRELLDWAAAANAWVLEDDYDGEFRYTGTPLATLKSLDRDGRVIYIGTFSKSIFPSLRMGYMVMHPGLVNDFSSARDAIDNHPSILEQPVMASFIGRGHFATHLRRMRQVYRERQSALLASMREHLTGLIEIQPDVTGLHLLGFMTPRLLNRMSLDALVAKAAKAGIILVPLKNFYRDGRDSAGLVFGFSSLPLEVIRDAVETLAALVNAPAAANGTS
ncbi:MocR-like pyridoxine biosynthesis transcription factor PdxR [Peristeroidobacter soli]|jgi:GntR family transcriptional regulator/MocR family aminotransferase|uniref:MocR-like pyridoxine biosynthesis transcription factor PdxR n=1 Tax=Peristeroidobacter soli TaxID=2497877 RepID=UPI00101C5225|nr:PLP-dependent aminotransferase family protein [Peristeroidobacter soli]